MAPAGFHLHFLFLIWMSVDSCFVISHRELLDIVSGRLGEDGEASQEPSVPLGTTGIKSSQ
jgi:hypothetical protein